MSILPVAVAAACLALWPADAAAQRGARPRGGGSPPAASHPAPAAQHAVPRPPGSRPPTLNHGYYRPYYPYYGGYYPYYPYYRGYYAPYWGGWGWSVGFGWGYGWGAWGPWGYPYGYGYAPYYHYPGYYYAPYCDLRLEVAPRDAEVYLDGYLVGVVDSFDGMFQRLHVPYGEHEVTVYLEGYQPIREKMLFRPGEDYRIKQVMQPLPAGAAVEPRPVPQAPPPDERRRLPVRGEEAPQWEQPQGRPPAEQLQPRAAMGDFGTLSIRVQPAGAEIVVDGERWDTPSGEDRLTLDLNEGTHRVEIRLEGHKPYQAEVRIRRGETQTLNVSLPRS